jgi:hypothetical protein
MAVEWETRHWRRGGSAFAASSLGTLRAVWGPREERRDPKGTLRREIRDKSRGKAARRERTKVHNKRPNNLRRDHAVAPSRPQDQGIRHHAPTRFVQGEEHHEVKGKVARGEPEERSERREVSTRRVAVLRPFPPSASWV